MSKVSQMLRMLFYLNDKYSSGRYVTISELADYLEVDKRQVRRYYDDFVLVERLDDIVSKRGPYGGYKLSKPLSDYWTVPSNIMLAINIATKNVGLIGETLKKLPNYITTHCVEGDNDIKNETYDRLALIVKGIDNKKILNVNYSSKQYRLSLEPYKIIYTNHTYYLYALYNGVLKCYDINKMNDIVIGDIAYVIAKSFLDEIKNKSLYYGLKDDGQEIILCVRYENDEILEKFKRYYENYGEADETNHIFTVKSKSENELFYPLFRIGTKGYTILNKDFKRKYLNYLQLQIYSLSK